MAADEVAEGLRGKQRGYKHAAGAELVHEHVSTALRVRPGYAALSGRCRRLPEPEQGVVYHDTGGRRRIWNQTTGIFQGCGMATTLFCLGLDRALERAKHQLDAAGIQHELFGYIDDLTILAKPEDLPTIYAAYINPLSQAGLQTRVDKCEVRARNPAAMPAGLPVPRVEQPTILRQHADDYSGLAPTPATADQRAEQGSLHSPASPRPQRQRTRRATAMARLMRLHKAGLDVQTSLVLLRTLTAGDMTRHMSTTGVPSQTSTQLDADLLSTLEELVQTHDLTAEQKDKYWHPVALGGLGFQSASAARLDARAASRALCEKPVLQRLGLRDRDDLLHYCPGLRPAPHRPQSSVNALTQEEASQQAPDTEPPDTTQRRFTRHRRRAEWTQRLRRTQTEPRQRAWAPSTTGKGAGARLGPPTRPDHHLADAHFRMAVRHRLGGLARAADGPCPFRKEDGTLCAGTVDANGRHALCCSYGGFMVKRHNNLRDTIARALREAGICDIAVEPWIRQPTGPGNPGPRADLRCADSDGQRAYLDLTIAHPASQQSLQAGGAHAQGAAARLAEQANRRKYNGVAGFQPLGFEASGAMGESTGKWLAQQVPEGPGRLETLSTLHRSIATCVVREAALLQKDARGQH
ncbi:unnamed protein product [Prorocentrum cordatum]|uniref:Reverse transcriptase domain-containing protein n=1 Tax=Prorocentrum cordatum TaxID=2364126 RepID=A0ABN9YBU9_9DINO|nr:unnamed protein product [Polarella glacialis]